MSFLHRTLPQPNFQPYDGSFNRDFSRRGSELLDHKIMGDPSLSEADLRPRSFTPMPGLENQISPFSETAPPHPATISALSSTSASSTYGAGDTPQLSLLNSVDGQRKNSATHYPTMPSLTVNENYGHRTSSPSSSMETISPTGASTNGSSIMSSASSDLSPQFCLCQPDPKIPRPRNGESLTEFPA